MLTGSWQFLSINDKGEKLGPKLVEARFPRDGILTVADRRLTIANPLTGAERSATTVAVSISASRGLQITSAVATL
jgi:hypothetical protein